MSSQRKPSTQRYSAQIRASQYDPDVDANHYNNQFNSLQQQQQPPQLHHPQPQRAISPRVSMDMSMHAPIPQFHDHYPVSSASSNSTATTFINLTNPDSNSNLNNASSDPTAAGAATRNRTNSSPTRQAAGSSSSRPSPASNSSAVTTSGSGATANGLTSTTTSTPSSSSPLNATSITAQLLQQPLPTLNSSSSPLAAAAATSAPSSSKSPFSIFPTSILGKKSSSSSSPSRRRAKTDATPLTSTQKQSQRSPPSSLPRSFGDGQKHHVKTGSIASVRSRLVARASRSSLQLNLRTHQNNPNPTLIPTPSQSPGGTWDDPNLAPSPFYPNMDPAFLQEQQLASSGNGGGRADSPGYNKEYVRNNGNTSIDRQEDGRLQLEQARAYYKSRKCLTWTRSKLLLLLANTILLGYAVTCTVVMTMSWRGDEWTKPYLDSGIMMIANHNVLFLLMATAPFGVFVALLGYIGIFAQSRKVLTFYNVLLWPLFAMITSIGYICYRRSHIALYQKLKFSWINEFSRDDRLVIQNALNCCGYRSLSDYPSYDLHCFPRAPLPSCESKFLQYQQDLLSNTSSAAFTLLPIQLLVMLVALLCSNHIDNLFRTAYPITPKLYTQ